MADIYSVTYLKIFLSPNFQIAFVCMLVLAASAEETKPGENIDDLSVSEQYFGGFDRGYNGWAGYGLGGLNPYNGLTGYGAWNGLGGLGRYGALPAYNDYLGYGGLNGLYGNPYVNRLGYRGIGSLTPYGRVRRSTEEKAAEDQKADENRYGYNTYGLGNYGGLNAYGLGNYGSLLGYNGWGLNAPGVHEGLLSGYGGRYGAYGGLNGYNNLMRGYGGYAGYAGRPGQLLL